MESEILAELFFHVNDFIPLTPISTVCRELSSRLQYIVY